MRTSLWIAATAALTMVAPGLAAAHHSYAMFDRSKTSEAKGTVAKVEWSNPHVFVWIYVPKTGGGYDLYAFESDAVTRLSRMGWSATSLPIGDKVAIDYYPLRDGRPGGKLVAAKLASGQTFATTDDPAVTRGLRP